MKTTTRDTLAAYSLHIMPLRFFYLRMIRWWRTQSFFLFKRAFDFSVAMTSIILLSPVFMSIAALIWLNDRGPIFYWQERVGRGGKVFAFPKFRSMVTQADVIRKQLLETNQHGAECVTFKMKHDPRITRVGRVLRRLSLDELPQLWCVLTGDMTLVGPRPALVSEVARYSLADRRRLSATPGLTCIWQVSGRSDIAFDEQSRMDVRYIESRSIWQDFKLLVATVPAVIQGRGAY